MKKPVEWKEREFEDTENKVIKDPYKRRYSDQNEWESLSRSDSAISPRQFPDQSLHGPGSLKKSEKPYNRGEWEAIGADRKDFEPDSSRRRDSLGF